MHTTTLLTLLATISTISAVAIPTAPAAKHAEIDKILAAIEAYKAGDVHHATQAQGYYTTKDGAHAAAEEGEAASAQTSDFLEHENHVRGVNEEEDVDYEALLREWALQNGVVGGEEDDVDGAEEGQLQKRGFLDWLEKLFKSPVYENGL